MCFQIVDDVLDVTGTDASLGKPAGNDLLEGVYTLPVIYALAVVRRRCATCSAASSTTTRSRKRRQLATSDGAVDAALGAARDQAAQADKVLAATEGLDAEVIARHAPPRRRPRRPRLLDLRRVLGTFEHLWRASGCRERKGSRRTRRAALRSRLRGPRPRARNRSTASLNAFGASTMRPCAAPPSTSSREPGMSSASSSASPTGVSESCEPVITSVGTRIVDELEAQLVGRVEDRADLRDERLGRLLQHDARDAGSSRSRTASAGGDRRATRALRRRARPCRPRPPRRPTPASSSRRHVVVAARGAREDRATGCGRGCSTPMICAITPPIDAPITCARSTPSASRTASASSAICSSEYGPSGRSTATGAAVVERVAAVTAPEGHALQRPAPRVGAEALDHQERRTLPAAEDVVVDRDAVARHDLRHRSPLRVPHCREHRARERESTLDRESPALCARSRARSERVEQALHRCRGRLRRAPRRRAGRPSRRVGSGPRAARRRPPARAATAGRTDRPGVPPPG